MASASGIKAGSAYIELGVSQSELLRGLKRASSALKSWGSSISGVGLGMGAAGGGILAPLVAGVTEFTRSGDQLDKMSQRTGVSVEELSALKHAAETSGTSIEDLETALKKMQRTMGDAQKGSKSAHETLELLGISMEDAMSQTPAEMFRTVADALNRIPDASLRAASAQEIFGRSGTMILPMVGNLKALTDEAKRFGLVMSTEDAKAAAELEDALGRLAGSVKKVAFEIGKAVGGDLAQLADGLALSLKSVRQFVADNSGAVLAVGALGTGILAAGAALIVTGALVSAAGTVIGALGTALGLLLSPIGLVTAAMAGVGIYAFVASGKAKDAFNGLLSTLNTVGESIKTTMAGIADALAMGDTEAASDLLWSALSVAARAGLNALKEAWRSFDQWLMAFLDKMALGAAAAGVDLASGMTKALVSASASWRAIVWDMSIAVQDAMSAARDVIRKNALLVNPALYVALKASEPAVKAAEETVRKDSIAKRDNVSVAEADALAKIERERVEINARLANASDKIGKDRARQYDADRAADKARLDALQQELEDKRAQLALDKAAVEFGAMSGAARYGIPAGATGRLGLTSEFSPIASAAKAMAEASVGRETVGTFSGAAVSQLGYGSTVDRIAKASEETAKNTAKIARNSAEERATFE